jgi:hypothetical protein
MKTLLYKTIVNWMDYVSKLSTADMGTAFGFNPPAAVDTLNSLCSGLHLNEVHDELKALYQQTDGIKQYYNGNELGELIWTASRVLATNQEYRSHSDFKELYMSFDQLLFISDAGNGDLFGCVALNGQFERRDIFVWNHEDDSRTWVAPDLATFLKWWTDGTITV